ncbi:MAG: hypothetical protein ACT4QB_01205 [Gammaproteobacteria bacterium]
MLERDLLSYCWRCLSWRNAHIAALALFLLYAGLLSARQDSFSCPFEKGCLYDLWLSKRPMTVGSMTGAGSPITVTIAKGERVRVCLEMEFRASAVPRQQMLIQNDQGNVAWLERKQEDWERVFDAQVTDIMASHALSAEGKIRELDSLLDQCDWQLFLRDMTTLETTGRMDKPFKQIDMAKCAGGGRLLELTHTNDPYLKEETRKLFKKYIEDNVTPLLK